ncbi:MAG: superoxide dismutase family protein [Elusimicrobia bacterium]|nr:superoxide dismutase family protein [Elusimicrobiota bacterium]
MITRIFAVAALFALSCSAQAATGAAKLSATAAGSSLAGMVKLEDTSAGLKVTAELTGVPAGDHGFHIHEFGSCDDAGKAAGSHYNPNKTHHGMVVKDGVKKAHAGDMGNITAGAEGKAVLQVVIAKVSLNGKNPVAGRAVILHEKADDFGQPAGNAGGRIACGTIVVTGE